MNETSLSAYNSIKGETQRNMWAKIYSAMIEMRKPATSLEISQYMNIEHGQVWKRLPELADKEKTGTKEPLIKRTNERGINPSGRSAVKWVVTEQLRLF